MNNVRKLRMKYMKQNEWILLDKNFKVSNGLVLNFYEDIHNFINNLIKKFLQLEIKNSNECYRVKINQKCIDTAMIYFHKYFIFKKNFPDIFSKYYTCIACILLSLKVCDCLFPLDSFLRISLDFFFSEKFSKKKSLDKSSISKVGETIFEIEQEILIGIGFDIDVDIIDYKNPIIMSYLKSFNSDILIQTTFAFIHDSFKLPLCLYYDPHLIYLACIYMNHVVFKIHLPDFNCKKWFNIIDENINFSIIEDISVRLKNLYDFTLKISEIRRPNDIEFLVKNKFSGHIIKFDLDFDEGERVKSENLELNETLKLNSNDNEVCSETDGNNLSTEFSQYNFDLRKDHNKIENSITENYECEILIDSKLNKKTNGFGINMEKVVTNEIYKNDEINKSFIENNKFKKQKLSHKEISNLAANCKEVSPRKEIKINYQIFKNTTINFEENLILHEIKSDKIMDWSNADTKLLENNA